MHFHFRLSPTYTYLHIVLFINAQSGIFFTVFKRKGEESPNRGVQTSLLHSIEGNGWPGIFNLIDGLQKVFHAEKRYRMYFLEFVL